MSYSTDSAGIQYIVDTAQKMIFERKRIIAQTVSRSLRLKSAERATSQPWKITITPTAIMDFLDARSLVENLLHVDRSNEVTINLGNNINLAWMTQYQGQLTSAQSRALTISNFSNITVTISNLPALGTVTQHGLITATTIIFRAGDLIQPTNSRYPYSVVYDVVRGTGDTITLTVNRPLITSENISVTGDFKIGIECEFHCLITKFPNYEIISYNKMQFSGDFEVMEKII